MYLKRILFVLAIVLINNSFSIAQQTGVLKGQVRDAVSKELLPGATFQLLSNLAKGTVTDIDGNYSMVLDTGYHRLVCNYIGYVPDTISIYITTNSITEKNKNIL